MKSIKQTLENKENIVVTAALPYANGTIHIGHLLEYIMADVYVRFLKLVGKNALYICASDMHGTPIVINAKKAGVKPEEFAKKYLAEHQKDFELYKINFDNYYHTNSPENKELALHFFKTLKEKGYIYLKEIEQFYDQQAGQFLPDRFIKGECPKCNAKDQYGDVCESCNSTYEPTDLINPYSTLTSSKPVLKKTMHYFFKLRDFKPVLESWFNNSDSTIQKEMKNWLNNWLEQGLQDWCISRDEPYFGFEIPDALDDTGEKKYLYVWLDAPIGYISSTKNYCDKSKGKWQDYWQSENGLVMHFIGKDIAYFHYLFWPAMLSATGISLPQLTTHGFITVDGKKMSKSRGTFFTAKEFFDLYGAQNLRFYYASNFNRSVVDVDLNLQDFKAVSNKVLIGSLGNFCFRTISFAAKNYSDGFDKVANSADEKKLVGEFERLVNGPNGILDSYYNQDFKSAVKQILQISDLGNVYFQKLEPWRARDVESEKQEVKEKLAFMSNLARNLAILVKPILPEFSRKVEGAFGVESIVGSNGDGLRWSDLGFEWIGIVKQSEKLVEKVELKKSNAGKSAVAAKEANKVKNKPAKKKEFGEREFALDIRVGQFKEVNDHPNAEKLYIFKIDFGPKFGERQIIAGLKKYLRPEELLGKKSLFLVNLKPAKLRGQLSCGMTLVAEDDEGNLSLLEVAVDTKLGAMATFDGFVTYTGQITFDIFEMFPLKVVDGKVMWKETALNVSGKILKLKNVKDGAKIC